MVQSVSSGLGVCVALVSGETLGPGSGFLFEQCLKTEDFSQRGLSVWSRGAGVQLFLSIQGHCTGPEDQPRTEACQ